MLNRDSNFSEQPFLEELSWTEIREQVKQIAPELATIIDKINPGDEYKLIRATYAYGDLIVNDGLLCLPNNQGKVVPFTDSSLSDHPAVQKLSYSAIPLFFTLEKSNEVFINTHSRIVPLNLVNPGGILGLFEAMDYYFGRDSQPRWSVSAGARSIIMLPKITESSGLKRLRVEFKLPASTCLKYLSDHASLFNAIAKHPNFTQPWENKVLFFTEDWFINQHDPAWFELYTYFFKHTWNQAQFSIKKMELSLTWESYVRAITSRNLKPNIYSADQLKHIISIATGMWPGFRPADDSQSVAPTRGIQQAFIDIYQLKEYLPTLMHAYYLLGGDIRLPVYYSLFFPAILEGAPHNESSSTIMFDLKNIKLLLDTAIERTSDNDSSFNQIIKNTRFDYFHVEPDKMQEIQPSRLLPEQDSALLNDQKHFKERIFCATSPFWRGCIRIRPTMEQGQDLLNK